MAMGNEAIAGVVHPIQDGLGVELASALERARVRGVAVTARDAAPLEGRMPALLVAELPEGERRIPADVLALARGLSPSMRLLLLCNESLTQPAITLQEGRVTLMGPPLSASKIASRIRVLLVGRVDGERHSSLGVREHLGERWWAAGFAPKQTKVGAPLVRAQASEGLTALVPAAQQAVTEDLLARASELVRRQLPASDLERALSELVGTSAAVAHLGPAGDRWTVFLPSPAWSAVLHSPMRLPPYWDLSADVKAGGDRLRSFDAASGDLLALLSSAAGAPEAVPSAGLAAAMADGGPIALDFIDGQARAPGGLLAEVR